MLHPVLLTNYEKLMFIKKTTLLKKKWLNKMINNAKEKLELNRNNLAKETKLSLRK